MIPPSALARRLLLILLLASGTLPGQIGRAAGTEAAAPDSLPDFKRLAWQDLRILMSRGEEAQFLEISDRAALAEWERRFWLRRDPTPTTLRNERREEHYKRLETARAIYHGAGEQGVDERGWDYVLFGPPDERVEIESWFDERGHHPAREIWIWLGAQMRAEYWDWNLDGEWETAHAETPSTRPDVKHRLESAVLETGQAEDVKLLDDLRLSDPSAYADLMRQLAEGEQITPESIQSARLMADLLGPKFRRMESNYITARQERRDTYVHDFGAEPLWAVFAVDCFRGEGGRTRVEVSHQVRLADLQCRWNFDEQVFTGELLRRVVFYDEDLQMAATQDERIPVRAERLDDLRRGVLLPGLAVVQLKPGRYRMALRLEDAVSRHLQIFTTDVQVPAFPEGKLLLSDITLASALAAAEGPGLFRKGEWFVVPHPLHSYSAGMSVDLYFEIYGLRTDAEGLNDYTVTYRIRRAQPELRTSWLWTRSLVVDPEVASTFLDRHAGATASHVLSVAVNDLAEDSYVLEIEVSDRLAGERCTGTTRFSVVNEAAVH
jgi:GWxTD domain-containing protein